MELFNALFLPSPLPCMSLRFYTQDSEKTSSQALVLMIDSDLRPGSTSSPILTQHLFT